MIVEEAMVSGDGWISDESSFYGDESEQQRLLSLCDDFTPGPFWRAHLKDPNVIRAPFRAQVPAEATSVMSEALPDALAVSKASSKPTDFMLNRRAMEQERLGRLGKRKRESSPPPALFNPAQGRPDAWQLGESVDDFVRRLPPLTTSVMISPWIWAHDPHRDSYDKSITCMVDSFVGRGASLLEQSLQNREEIRTKGLYGTKSVQTKSLSQESKALQQHIADLAGECGVLSGKWMFFPKLEEVNRIWKKVVEGVISGRLGPTAKVATDQGEAGDRLICIYTKDFRDEDDVLRVLQELDTMGLLSSGRSIYYKSDAFTYLELNKETAEEYGLRASLYSSSKMMAASRLAKASSMPRKKQSTLNRYF